MGISWLLFSSFSIPNIVLPSQKTACCCLLYSSGSPSELWEVIWLFSFKMDLKNQLRLKRTWKIRHKLVTWIKRRGRRWLGDIYPVVTTLGKFEDNCSEPPYTSPAESLPNIYYPLVLALNLLLHSQVISAGCLFLLIGVLEGSGVLG